MANDLIQDIDQFIDELQSPPISVITEDLRQSVISLFNRYLASYYLPARQFVKDYLVDLLPLSGNLDLAIPNLKADDAKYIQIQIQPGLANIKVNGKDACQCKTYEDLKACLVEMLKPVPNEYFSANNTVLQDIIPKIVEGLNIGEDVIKGILTEQ
jgi:hypothetical protein